MKPILRSSDVYVRCFSTMLFRLVAICSLCLLSAVIAFAQSYTVTDLGTLGGSGTYANGINAVGQIVGEATDASENSRAFLWQNGVMTDLGTLTGIANGINDTAEVVGQSYTTNDAGVTERAFLWQNGVMTDLGTLGGLPDGLANAINNTGQVVGYSADSSGYIRACLWQNQVVTDLGTLGGNESIANGINNMGQVVGYSADSSGYIKAFLWQNGVMTDIGTLGLPYGVANGINNTGQVVGQSINASGDRDAFLWQNGSMTDLGTLGGNYSYASAINNTGQVVGISSDASGNTDAFLWQNGVMNDLNILIPANSGWVLIYASAINDKGQIVGYGTYQGQERAFLLTPATALQAYNVAVSRIMSHGATITWNTNIPADSTVEYGTSVAYGSSVTASALTTSHSIQLTGLSGATLYHYRVSSNDGAGHSAKSGDLTFATFPGNQAIPQFTYSNLRKIAGGDAVDITMTNVGDQELLVPTLRGAVLGIAASPSSPPLPLALSDLAPGGTETYTFTLYFPNAGASGTSTKLSIAGLFGIFPQLGNFSFTWRVTLP